MFKFIEKIIIKYKLQEFIKFVIVGLLATVISYVIYRLFLNYTGKDIAYTLGYGISFCFNLIASHLFTFKKKVNKRSTLGFTLAHLTNYLIQVGLLNIFTFIGVPKIYAPIPVYIIAIPVNFFTVRFALNNKYINR